jgi:glycerol-3-phosphate dehydrogenase
VAPEPFAPPPPSSGFDRAQALRRLAEQPFDVLVVGGGVTGCGVALDAAARGLRTALVERRDFAWGTSSRSSKLVHGGLRYLQQGDLGLVAEALRERQRLLRNAPHLVQPLTFLIPLFGRGGVVSASVRRAIGTALWLYDLAGGVRIGKVHRRVDAAEAQALLPSLRPDRLVAGFLYYDATADDARLALSLARTAACDFGATVANYCEAVAIRHDETGAACGATLALRGPGERGELEVRASVVVNATGAWADDLRALDEGTHPRTTRPAKGVHLTLPAERLPAKAAAVLPVPGDRRTIFVVPFPDGADTYVGTTDTAYDGPLDDAACEPEDVEYLLSALQEATTAEVGPGDVTGVWAGVRPLLAPEQGGAPGGRRAAAKAARTADLSRRHRVLLAPSGVVTVTGGKLTTYRQMAEDTVDLVVRRLGPAAPPGARRCPTRRLRLRAASPRPGPEADPLTRHLHSRYGSEAPAVLALAEGRPELLEPLVPGLPDRRVEVLWAARQEMALTVEDVLTRRTRLRLRRAEQAAAVAEDVARLLAEAQGRPIEELLAEARAAATAIRAELARALAGLEASRPGPATQDTASPTGGAR